MSASVEEIIPFYEPEKPVVDRRAELYKGIGKRLREARLNPPLGDANGPMTQREVAKAAGISRSIYVSMEHGHGPIPIDRLLDVCEALGASPWRIIWGEPRIVPESETNGGLPFGLTWDVVAMAGLCVLVVVVLLAWRWYFS